MKEKKKDNKRFRFVIIIGLMIVLILLLLVLLAKCSKGETSPGVENGPSSSSKNEASSDKEIDLPENPSIGETVTGEEVEDEDGVTVGGSAKDMDKHAAGFVSADELEVEDSSDKSNTSSSNKNPGNSGNNNTDEEDPGQEEEQPPKPPEKPTEEEESGQSGDEETDSENKFGNLY